MALALTVFGFAANGIDPTPCYVLLRTVRGCGRYPEPNLPRDTPVDGISRSAVRDTPLELIVWDQFVPAAEEVELQSAMSEGRLMLPAECPIAAGQTIAGLPFGPLIVEQEFQKSRISGVGLLYRKGIATEALINRMKDVLDRRLGSGAAPGALDTLVATIDAVSGIAEVFKQGRLIGGVDFFYRAPAMTHLDGPFFDVAPEKPDFRTRAPMLGVHVRRHVAPLDQKFRLQVTLGNHDEVLRSVLVDIDSRIPEIVVSAPAHITDVSLNVFDEAGNWVDHVKGMFNQGFQFGLSALGAVDALPPPFSGAPKSPDLETRPRMHTMAFEGPSAAGNRSGGLDVLRRRAAKVAALVGPLSTKLENIWFERGVKGQVEVIRWIKKEIEQPGLAKAYVVDPYLGSNALKRVVARHGNESAELFIAVSPGNIDPDADTAATTTGSDYLAKLTRAATDWADKLAGRISVVHVKRGDGSRQAFHDRYLCTINRQGIPTAYLLSNSLSRAAGDWPFVACELDRVMSWRVHAYILEMVEGRIGGIRPEVIWTRAPSSAAPQVPAANAPASSSSAPAWVAPANACLADIQNIIFRGPGFQSQVSARLDAFLRDWPHDIDTERFADALFKAVSHRDALVLFVGDFLRGSGRVELSRKLDERLLDKFLETLPGTDQKRQWLILPDARRGILGNVSATIARKENATNFVRAKLNPSVYAFVARVETQRFVQSAAWEAHEAALFLCIIALKAAVEADAPEAHRIGVATDHIHWLGRLMRSDVAASVYVNLDPVPREWLDDLSFAAQTIAQARRALGNALDGPIGRVNNDPLVPPIFKETLASLVAGGEVAAVAPR